MSTEDAGHRRATATANIAAPTATTSPNCSPSNAPAQIAAAAASAHQPAREGDRTYGAAIESRIAASFASPIPPTSSRSSTAANDP